MVCAIKNITSLLGGTLPVPLLSTAIPKWWFLFWNDFFLQVCLCNGVSVLWCIGNKSYDVGCRLVISNAQCLQPSDTVLCTESWLELLIIIRPIDNLPCLSLRSTFSVLISWKSSSCSVAKCSIKFAVLEKHICISWSLHSIASSLHIFISSEIYCFPMPHFLVRNTLAPSPQI